MADPEYMNIGDPGIKLIEECSELIKIVCKGERFGWGSRHPHTGIVNFDQLKYEWNDVKRTYSEFVKRVIDEEEL